MRHSDLTYPLAMLAICAVWGCADCGPSNNGGDDVDAGMDSSPDDDSSNAPEGFREPFAPSDLGWGLHVIARDESDIYVAGGTPDRGKLMHYDGEQWAAEDVGEVPLLNWVLPLDDETIVVGNGGTVIANTTGTWTVEETPTTEDLWGVWGASSGDVWAVGGRGRAEGQATILRRRDGEWTAVEIPDLERPQVNAFFKVWGSAADDVYIVGQRGAVLHWTGTELEELGLGTAEDLISLFGTGPDDIIVVGGRSNGVMSHWNGSDWTTQNIAPAPGVNGVWMPAPGEFWIGGVRGMLRKGVVTDDGFDVPRTTPLTQNDIHAVYGVPGFGLLAVGGNFAMTNGPYEGVALVKEGELQ